MNVYLTLWAASFDMPMLVWCLVAGVFLFLIFARISVLAIAFIKRRGGFFSIGSEREEFFVPGDNMDSEYDDQDYDCECSGDAE